MIKPSRVVTITSYINPGNRFEKISVLGFLKCGLKCALQSTKLIFFFFFGMEESSEFLFQILIESGDEKIIRVFSTEPETNKSYPDGTKKNKQCTDNISLKKSILIVYKFASINTLKICLKFCSEYYKILFPNIDGILLNYCVRSI